MRLNDPLVTSFVYKQKEYAIDLSFDNVLDVFDVLEDKFLRKEEKAKICLGLLLDELFLDEKFEDDEALELFNYIFENFIKIERKKVVEYDLKGNPLPVVDDEDEGDFIDIAQDAEYIYASFMQAYGIDLFEQQGKLHWHKFRALLQGLPPDTIMQRIIQIRTWKESKYDSKEFKNAMRKLQRIHALNKEVTDDGG